jgi:hypothetical protein
LPCACVLFLGCFRVHCSDAPADCLKRPVIDHLTDPTEPQPTPPRSVAPSWPTRWAWARRRRPSTFWGCWRTGRTTGGGAVERCMSDWGAAALRGVSDPDWQSAACVKSIESARSHRSHQHRHPSVTHRQGPPPGVRPCLAPRQLGARDRPLVPQAADRDIPRQQQVRLAVGGWRLAVLSGWRSVGGGW